MDRTLENILAQRRRGNTTVALLVGLLVLVLVLLGFLGYSMTVRQAQEARHHALEAERAALEARNRAELERLALSLESPNRDSEPVTAGIPAADASFDGKGTLRGRATTAPDIPFPERWTLTVEPSRTLSGRERAAFRRIEFGDGEVEFEVPDLPLGGYAIGASAPGMNSLSIDVLLAKGQENQYVMLRPMTKAGFIDGGVMNTQGEPLDGVRVVLESTATKVRREVLTDYAGNYLFEQVLDGKYTLTFGSPDSPLIPSQEILFKAPSLRFPTREIPHDASIKITVVDVHGNAVPGAQVRGFGTNGGQVEGETDSLGRLDFRFLQEGRFRLYASHDQRHGKKNLEVARGEAHELTIELKD